MWSQGIDKERLVRNPQGWEVFKNYMKENNPNLDIDLLLSKQRLKRSAIVSYGLIEFVRHQNSICYHVFKRRHTIEYDILIRGFAQTDQLFDLISLLSRDERRRIIECDWQTVWNDYWTTHSIGHYTGLAAQSERRFDEIKTLTILLNPILPQIIDERPYIFPKGRPERGERGIDASLREAREETGSSYSTGELYFQTPIVQTYTGSDDNPYTDYYYVWKQIAIYSCSTQDLSSNADTDFDVINSQSKTSGQRIRSKSNKCPKVIRASYDPSNEDDDISIRSPAVPNRTKTISHELESDAWLEIPLFRDARDKLEWQQSVKAYRDLGLFERHLNLICQIHEHLNPC